MGILSREQLLKKEDLKIGKVDLGGKEFVYVRQMTGHERDSFEQSMLRKVVAKNGLTTYEQSLNDFRSKLAVQTVCNEKGENIFSPEDYKTLSHNISAFRLEKIIVVAQELNKISQKDKEEIVKN